MKQRLRQIQVLVVTLALGCGVPHGDVESTADVGTAQDGLDVAGTGTLSTGTLATAAFNTCGNSGTAPQIFSNTIMSPKALLPGGGAPTNWDPSRGRITRGNIQYTSADGFRFELVTDRCTFIKEVRVGSRVVTSTFTEGFWYSAQTSLTPPTDPARYGYNLWVFFPKQPDGSSDTLSVTVGRVGGTGTATYSLPMVRVDEVEAVSVRAPVAFSRAELMNIFGRSLYRMFNGAQNSAVLTSSDGSTRRVYGYDPNSLAVSVEPSTGIAFSFKFKVQLNNWCDPTVRAHGNFKLKADGNGIAIDWINVASASLDWPGICQAAQLVPILGLIPNMVYNIIENSAGASVRSSIETAVTGALPNLGNANLFLDGSSTERNQVLVYLKLPVPSVKIRVPYDAYDMARGATWFPSGENITLLASGLGMNDYVAGVTPQTTLHSGPNGVPRSGTTDWPRAQTVARTASALVWSNQPVGRLLARRTDSLVASTTTYQYTPGCTVKTFSRFGSASLRFGVNDTAADAQRMRGVLLGAPGYQLRALFLNDLGLALADGAPRCGSFSNNPVIGTVATMAP